MEPDLRGACAVITGAGSGIGSGLARAFVAEGARVVVADIELAPAQALVRELTDRGAEAIAVRCDVAERGEVEALLSRSLEAFGRVNVLCNNAGVGTAGGVDRTSERAFEWTFAVNVAGVFHGASVFAEALAETASAGGFAHVLNTASEHALGLPEAGQLSVYTASKHAVLGLSDAMRRDLAPRGVGVSILCPGSVRTRVWDAARNRHPRYGGPRHAPEQLAQVLERGLDPDAVGRTSVAAIKRGDFYVLTHPHVRSFVARRYEELLAALDAAERRAAETAR